MRRLALLIFFSGCLPQQLPTPITISPPNCYCVTYSSKETSESTKAAGVRADKKEHSDKVEKLKEEVTKAKESVERMKDMPTPVGTPVDDHNE